MNKKLLYQYGITNMTGLFTFLVKRGADTLPANFTALTLKSKNGMMKNDQMSNM